MLYRRQESIKNKMKKSISNAVTTFRKYGRGVIEKVSFNGNKSKSVAVTFEKPVVVKETPPAPEYKPSEKKIRSHKEILESMEMTISNAEYKKDNMGTLTPQQQIERLEQKTKAMIASNKAESNINNKAAQVNEKYAITDSSITVSENQWYKILHKNTEEQYNISYQNNKCYIVTHLSTIHMLVLTQQSLLGLYGTAVEEHMPKSRFDSIVANGPTVRTLAQIYKVVDIQRQSDMPKDEDFWKNPVPVFNVTD